MEEDDFEVKMENFDLERNEEVLQTCIKEDPAPQGTKVISASESDKQELKLEFEKECYLVRVVRKGKVYYGCSPNATTAVFNAHYEYHKEHGLGYWNDKENIDCFVCSYELFDAFCINPNSGQIHIHKISCKRLMHRTSEE